jgi:hypothetical protein
MPNTERGVTARSPAGHKKQSETVALQQEVAELKTQLADAEALALAWAHYYAVSRVTLESVRRAIPPRYRNHGDAIEGLSLEILGILKNQPEQNEAIRLVINRVIANLNMKLDRKIRARTGPSTPMEMKRWLNEQAA